MRLKLKEGKQRELIEKAKIGKTWEELSKELNTSVGYLRNELKKEERLLSEDIYNLLCQTAGKNYNEYVIDKKNDDWGRSKGGKSSKGNTKQFTEPKESEQLAELFGIILGDGHIHKHVKENARCYSIQVTGDSRNDFDYLSNYTSSLIKNIFKERPKLKKVPNVNAIFIILYGKSIVEFIIRKGIKAGNKKINNQDIPNWITKNDKYLKACIRGLIDTDGSVHLISKENKNLRICFTSYIPPLINQVREALTKFNLHPSKIIKENQIFLSRKEDIILYKKIIGFSNSKHLNRIRNFENLRAPVVQSVKDSALSNTRNSQELKDNLPRLMSLRL